MARDGERTSYIVQLTEKEPEGGFLLRWFCPPPPEGVFVVNSRKLYMTFASAYIIL